MKQSSIVCILVGIILALQTLFVCIGCNSELVPSPELESIENSDSGTSARTIAAPQNVSATQGGKQKISLAWSAVNKAVRYYIYAAATPFEQYVKVGETTKDSYEYSAVAGLTRYFKITAVNFSGEESEVSSVVSGTTLACPVISDIQLPESSEDSSVTVYWYMENAQAYAGSLIYVITCLNGSTVVSTATMHGLAADGTLADTMYTFANLTQNTAYTYVVEAYLTTAQLDSETSDAVDYATAVSLKPKAPVNLTATEGTSTTTITLTFTLPEEAYIKQSSSTGTSSSADTYVQYPLFFKIYRRIAVDAGETPNAWSDAMAAIYYKSGASGNCTTDATSFTTKDSYAYDVGETISWTDSASLARGTKYEYKVLSVVFEKGTTSESSSVATSVGWEAASPSLRLGEYLVKDNSTVDENGTKTTPTLNVSATLTLIANWTSLGKESDYKFVLKSKRTKTCSADTGDSPAESYTLYNSIDAVNNATILYTICKEDNTVDTTVRGYYAYTLYIVPKEKAAADSTASANALDCVTAAGVVLVTSEVSLPTFTGFALTSGYKDKVSISWINEKETGSSTYLYELERYTLDENGNQTGTVTTITPDLSATAAGSTYTYVDSSLTSGTKYVYTLYATTTSGLKVPSAALVAETLGTPDVLFDSASPAYESITASWKPVRQAASYEATLKNGSTVIGKDTIVWSTDSSGIVSYSVKNADGTDSLDTVTMDAEGKCIYTILKPQGYDDAQISGKTMTLTVSASSVSSDVVLDTTTSSDLSVCTLGPSQTAVAAKIAKYTSTILVTWKAVSGAESYLVRRDRCNSANTNIISTDLYIVPASPTGSNGEIKVNNETVSAATAQLASNVITLTDNYAAQPSGNTVTTWQKNQDMLAWGYPYRYTVIPLENASDSCDAATDSTITVNEVTYRNTDKLYATGSTIGYGVDVRATKSEDPNKVTITWTKPYLGTTAPDPKLWRSVDGKNTWEPTSASLDSTGTFIISPSGSERVVPYDYAVVYNGETPHNTYLAAMTSALDETFSPTEPLNKGYPFAIAATAVNVTTNGEAGYSEKITWTLWDYDTRAVGPAASATYTVAAKNANFASGWQTVATVDKDGIVATNNPASYMVNMVQAGQSITLTPTGMSDSAINTGLLRVLRDYKHYYEVVLTRTNSEGT